MNLNPQFSSSLAQTGKVSVSQQRISRGLVKNEVHIQCDCTVDSLLSDIASCKVPKNSRKKLNWLSTQLQQNETKEAEGKWERDSLEKLPPREKSLIMRVKSAKFRDDELQLINGEITLLGEDVIVRNGVSYIQNKSQLEQMPCTGPPVVRGSNIEKKRLEALASEMDRSRNLYIKNSKLLNGHDQRPLIENPDVHFGSQEFPLATVAKTSSSAELISDEVLKKIFPNYARLSNMRDACKPSARTKSSKVCEKADFESNKVVMASSRCILKDNSIVALRGLLQVGSAWHPVNNGILIGSDNPNPVIISGIPVYKDVTACEPILLNNVTLYSLGTTVYVSDAALLEDAVVHVDGKKINIEDLQLVGICGKKPPENPNPARLFVQGGKFTVGESSLNVYEGTVWFRDVDLKIPEDTTEEVRVQDSITFVLSDSHCDKGANRALLFENQDIIYKNNMLLLDDLTPLLKGGVVSHENKQKPLAWLSDDIAAMLEATQSCQVQTTPSPDNRCDRDYVLSDGVCILDDTGIFIIEGTLIVNDKKVIIHKGVPHFSPNFTRLDRAKDIEMLPPRLTGLVLMDAKGARDLDAKFIKGSAILKNICLAIRDGRLIINHKVPAISDCKLVLNQGVFNACQLGIRLQSELEDDGRGTYDVSSELIDSSRAQVIDKGASKNQKQPHQDFSVKDVIIESKIPASGSRPVRTTIGKSDLLDKRFRASDTDDSGRVTSGFDSGLSDNDQSPLNENQEMPKAQRFDAMLDGRSRDVQFQSPLKIAMLPPKETDKSLFQSSGILGTILVASNQESQLLVSLRSRIETSLCFLEGHNSQPDK